MKSWVLLAAALPLVAHAATFTVTNLNDSGDGSLRAAIAQSNAMPGANTITFAPALTGTIVLTSGEMLVTQGPLTIAGPGAQVLAIDGNGSDRIISVEDPGTIACPALTSPSDYLFTISGLTLRNGNRTTTNSGGALVSRKSLAMIGMVVEGSQARLGGGVAFLTQYAGQTLTIQGSRISDNVARPLTAVSTIGGGLYVGQFCAGVYSATTVTIADTVVSGNEVRPADVQQGYGAGVYLYLPVQGTATISNSRIADNRLVQPATLGSFSYGGGGMGASVTSLSVHGTEFSGNAARVGGGLEFFNSDLALQGPADRLQFMLSNSTVSGNTAYATGAGVQVFANIDAQILNSTITANTPSQPTSTGGLRVVSNTGYAVPTVSIASTIASGGVGYDVGIANGVPLPFVLPATNSMVGLADTPSRLTISGTGNLIGAAPELEPLAFNGGSTRTHALKAISLAIDTGANPQALGTDQRGAGNARVQGAAADMGAYEYPASCAGFVDSANTGAFCASIDWLRNRRVTLGCSTGMYCPEANVQREQMAAFMNRLGRTLTPDQVMIQEAIGPITLPGEQPEPAVRKCITGDIAAMGYPRQVLVRATASGLADTNLASWRAALVVSYDGGLNWDNPQPGLSMYPRASSLPGAWGTSYTVERFDLPPGTQLRFGMNFRRDQNTASTGNLVDARCQLVADIYNRNGTAAPH